MRVPAVLPTLAVGVALALGGCGSDDDGPTASTGSTTSATTAPSDASTTSTAPPTTTGGDAAAAPEGDRFSGTGYSTTAPEGWRDVSDQLQGSAIRIDRSYAGPAEDGFATNVVIIRETPPAIRGKEIGELEGPLRQQAAETLGVDAPTIEGRPTVDGEDAVRWTLRRRQGGRDLVQRQVAVVHDDALYTLTLTTTTDADDSGAADLQTILDGWRWESGAGGEAPSGA